MTDFDRRKAEARAALHHAITQVYAGAGWDEVDAVADYLDDMGHAVTCISSTAGLAKRCAP